MHAQPRFKGLVASAVLAVLGLAGPQARASIDLGPAVDYGVLVEPGAHNFQLNNSDVIGNVGIGAGVNAVQIAGNGFIKPIPTLPGSGRLDLADASASVSNPGNVAGGVHFSVPAVTTALNTVNALSSMFAGEAGTALTISGGGQMVLASNGMLDASGNRVFTVAANAFNNNNQGFTIVGSATDFVIININNGTSNEQIGGPIKLSGGIDVDHVLFNFTGTGGNLGASAGGATINGIIMARNMAVNLDNITINGRLFGGRSGSDFQIVSGFHLIEPLAVPEPTSLLLLTIGGVGLLSVRRLRKQSA